MINDKIDLNYETENGHRHRCFSILLLNIFSFAKSNDKIEKIFKGEIRSLKFPELLILQKLKVISEIIKIFLNTDKTDNV